MALHSAWKTFYTNAMDSKAKTQYVSKISLYQQTLRNKDFRGQKPLLSKSKKTSTITKPRQLSKQAEVKEKKSSIVICISQSFSVHLVMNVVLEIFIHHFFKNQHHNQSISYQGLHKYICAHKMFLQSANRINSSIYMAAFLEDHIRPVIL